MAVSMKERLADRGLKAALIIDDAYEDPIPEKIGAEAKTQFLRAARGEAARALLLKEFPGLDIEADDAVQTLLEESLPLQQLWNLYSEKAEFAWCKSAFNQFESDRASKRSRLLPLEKFLEEAGLAIQTLPGLDEDQAIEGSPSLVFIDFFLLEEQADQALTRVTNIGRRFGGVHERDRIRFRPLVFLISNRADLVRPYQERFRDGSNIKGSFFRFIDKANLGGAKLVDLLNGLLDAYPSATLLADYVDEFRAAAVVALDGLNRLELTDLALLHLFRVEAENEILGNYLNWLLSEAVSGGVQSSIKLNEVAEKLNTLTNRPIDGHIVAPRNELFNIYAKAVCRYDVRDREGNRGLPIGFGDILLDTAADEGKHKYLAVLHPACDIIRPQVGQEALCVLGDATYEGPANVKGLLKRELYDKGRHLIEVAEGEEALYRILEWDVKAVKTVLVSDLEKPERYQRLARLQPLFAHQLSEVVLRDLGRVGVPVTPSIVEVLDAEVRMKYKEQEVAFTSKGTEIFAAVRAQKRLTPSEELQQKKKISIAVCFTLPFLERIKADAESLKANAGQDASKFDEIIAACTDGRLAMVFADKDPVTVGRIKIWQKTPDNWDGLCNIALESTA